MKREVLQFVPEVLLEIVSLHVRLLMAGRPPALHGLGHRTIRIVCFEYIPCNVLAHFSQNLMRAK